MHVPFARTTGRSFGDSASWHYWPSYPPDPRRLSAVEWRQGDDKSPCDGKITVDAVTALLDLERDGRLPVGLWWRPVA